MDTPVTCRVEILPVAFNLRTHFENALARLQAIDVCSLCMMERYEQEIEIEKIAQGLAQRLRTDLACDVYTSAHTKIREALDTADKRFSIGHPHDSIRRSWKTDLSLILESLIELGTARPKVSGLNKSL